MQYLGLSLFGHELLINFPDIDRRYRWTANCAAAEQSVVIRISCKTPDFPSLSTARMHKPNQVLQGKFVSEVTCQLYLFV